MDKENNEKKLKKNHDSKIFYSTLSSKNQITIPSVIREKLDAYPGDQIEFSVDEDNRLVVDIIKKDALLSLYGSMPPKKVTVQKDWNDIREEARSEIFDSNNE